MFCGGVKTPTHRRPTTVSTRCMNSLVTPAFLTIPRVGAPLHRVPRERARGGKRFPPSQRAGASHFTRNVAFTKSIGYPVVVFPDIEHPWFDTSRKPIYVFRLPRRGTLADLHAALDASYAVSQIIKTPVGITVNGSQIVGATATERLVGREPYGAQYQFFPASQRRSRLRRALGHRPRHLHRGERALPPRLSVPRRRHHRRDLQMGVRTTQACCGQPVIRYRFTFGEARSSSPI